MKKSILILLTLTLFSCGPTLKTPEYLKEDSTAFNTPLKKELGESILNYQEGFFANAIIVNKEARAVEKKVKRIIKSGEVFVNTKSSGKFDYYYPEGIKDFSAYGLIINTDDNTARLWIADMGMTFYELEEPLQFTSTKRPDPNHSFIKKEFLYNGKSGHTVKFTYREYVDNWARPAFAQDLQYDLNESNVIGFQGMRIEVEQATNTNIAYKVLNGFTK